MAASRLSVQIHEDFVFDTAGSVGGQLDAPIRIEGVDGLDKADGADGDQILHAHAGVVKALGNVDHQPEVVLDEQRLGFLIPLCPQPVDDFLLFFRLQRCRKYLCPAYVMNVAASGKQDIMKIRNRL